MFLTITTSRTLDAAPRLELVALAVLPGAVILLAVALLVSHWRTWRSTGLHSASESERSYQRRRFRRRMQTSAMLALVGVALIVGQLIPAATRPSLFVFFWTGVVLLLFWVVLLALADAAATRNHARRLLSERTAERSRLEEELVRLKRRKNDDSPPAPPGD
ncbi:MAG TPA: hypothetical protein VGN42_18395 [Pirellulales bacterium]|jgi:uncharacterized membrane protein|nr:hypothetical protein [Pirellulales bacterium]